MHSSNTYKPGGFLKRTDPLHPFLPSEPIVLNQSESFEFLFETDHVMVHMCTIIPPEDNNTAYLTSRCRLGDRLRFGMHFLIVAGSIFTNCFANVVSLLQRVLEFGVTRLATFAVPGPAFPAASES